MTVQRRRRRRVIEVSGVGYAPRGAFTATGREVDSSELADIARAALLCNDAILRETDGEWQLEGDPTEGALLALAMKAGLDARFEAESLPRIDVIPSNPSTASWRRCITTTPGMPSSSSRARRSA
jgi:magnesium-transporting ATPase (P-type)